MKTINMLVLFLLSSMFFFSSCQKEPSFDYPMTTLYGNWETTEVKTAGWENIVNSSYYYTLPLSHIFYEDGSYYCRCFFGDIVGTYKASGKTIIIYVNGNEEARYDVFSLFDNDSSHLRMYQIQSGNVVNPIEFKMKKIQ